MSEYHIPVLLQSVCTLLDIKPGRKFVDATFGGGGHASAIVDLGGYLLGLDQDPDAFNEALQPALALAKAENRFIQVRSNFIHLEKVVKSHNWQPLWGVLFDLGVSYHQLATPQRGFSFQSVGPLDMRMDPDLPNTAATLVNVLTKKQLESIFTDYGQEPAAASIAKKIIDSRPLESTDELARILFDSNQRRRVFQSLRIAVNDELTALATALPQAFDILETGGRLVVISFHSLEDRIVKDQFMVWEKSGHARSLITKPIVPTPEEMMENSRSKSAKLRAIIKI